MTVNAPEALTPLPLPVHDPRALSVLTTEHFALQGLRASTISDSSSRASLYLSALSGTLVALSLPAGATRPGPAFVVMALIVAPTLIFLGVATFARVLESAVEDSFYAIGINRIRHLYLELRSRASRTARWWRGRASRPSRCSSSWPGRSTSVPSWWVSRCIT